jgi:hypothetical protein
MKHKLTENYIINIMREEWRKKIDSLISESPKEKPKGLKLQFDVDSDGSKESVIGAGLKVQKKKPSSKNVNVKGDPSAGLVYTVVSVNDRDGTVTLKRPDPLSKSEKTIVITKKEFENEFERK